MSLDFRQSTSATANVGPFISSANGTSAATGLSSPTGKLFVNGTVSAGTFTPVNWTDQGDGFYSFDLPATNLASAGRFRVEFPPTASYMAVWHDWRVMSPAGYDLIYASGTVQANVTNAVTLAANQDVRNVTGTVTNATGVTLANGAITASTFATGAITATSIASAALAGKGDWASFSNCASLIFNTTGSVWFVATNGTSGGTGTSFASAVDMPYRATNLANYGDVVLIGPGVYDMGTFTAAFRPGVRVIGAGRGNTLVKSQAEEATQGAVFPAATDGYYGHFSIYGYNAAIFGVAPIGFVNAATGFQPIPDNYTYEDMDISSDTGVDGFIAQLKLNVSNPTQSYGRIINCTFRSEWDAINIFTNGSIVWDAKLFVDNCVIQAIGGTSGADQTRGVICSSGTMSLSNCLIIAKSTSATQQYTYGAQCRPNFQSNDATLILDRTRILTQAVNGTNTFDVLLGQNSTTGTGGGAVYISASTLSSTAGGAMTYLPLNTTKIAPTQAFNNTGQTTLIPSTATISGSVNINTNQANAGSTIGSQLAATGSGGGGNGDTVVNHNTGGTDNLRVVDSLGNGVNNVTLRAYLSSNYNAGTYTVAATAYTGPDGRWQAPMMLFAGNTYTIVTQATDSQPNVMTTVTI